MWSGRRIDLSSSNQHIAAYRYHIHDHDYVMENTNGVLDARAISVSNNGAFSLIIA
jgi:hypothetical protein